MTNTAAPKASRTKLDYKLENAHQRFEGSFDALISYLAHQGGVNPHSLQMVKQSIHQCDCRRDNCHHHHHNYSSFTELSDDEELNHSSYAQKCVKALTQLHQFAECVVDDATTNVKLCEELKTIILMTAWESLARYLQLMQTRLERQYHQNALVAGCQQQTKQSATTQHRGPRSRSASPSEPRRCVSRQSLNQLSEAVVSCQKEWILLQHQHQKTKQ